MGISNGGGNCQKHEEVTPRVTGKKRLRTPEMWMNLVGKGRPHGCSLFDLTTRHLEVDHSSIRLAYVESYIVSEGQRLPTVSTYKLQKWWWNGPNRRVLCKEETNHLFIAYHYSRRIWDSWIIDLQLNLTYRYIHTICLLSNKFIWLLS